MIEESESKVELGSAAKSQLVDKGGLHFAKSQMIDDIKSKLSKRCVLEEAQDYLIYGLEIRKLDEKGKIKEGIIYIKPNEDNKLVFLSKGSNKSSTINLYKLIDITFGKGSGSFANVTTKELALVNENCCVTLHMNNFKFVDFILMDEQKLDYFCVGILSFLEKNIKETKNLHSDLVHLKKIWKEYDTLHNKFLNKEQFSQFLDTINFHWKKKTNDEVFREIDKKNSGKIIFKDFLFFYEKVVTGDEFREVFQKYSSDPKKKYLNLKGLMDFLEKEQKQKISLESAMELLKRFSKKQDKGKVEKENQECNGKNDESVHMIYENYINTFNEEEKGNFNNLKLNFREFVNLLIDRNLNSVYNNEFFAIHQNMDLPLIDYFMYSSHNTYLTGNQMIGTSSIEMYNYCLKNGCRLVELDCWDSSSGPIITHWHFPVSKLVFKEVLKNIKKFAFKKSPFPVTLSVENHCNEENQKIMFEDLQEVFGDGELFLIDKENPPLIYPSPNELKGKIIVKCRRKRFLQNVVNTNTEALMNFSPRASMKFENNLSAKGGEMFTANNNSEREEEVVQGQKIQTINIDKNNLVKAQDVIQEIQEVYSPEGGSDVDQNTNEDKYFDITPTSSKNCKFKISLEHGDRRELTFSKDFTLSENKNQNSSSNYFESQDNPEMEKSSQKHSSQPIPVPDNNKTTTKIAFTIEKDQVKDTTITETNLINGQKLPEHPVEEEKKDFQFKHDYQEDREFKLKNMKIDLKESESINLVNNDDNHNKEYQKKAKKNFVSFVSDSERGSENEIELGNGKQSKNLRSDLIKKLKDKFSTKINPEPSTAGRKKSITIDIDNRSISDAITNLQELQAKKKLEKHYTIASLSTLIGMIGVPFDQNDFVNFKNLPWECVSLGEPEFNAFTRTIENKVKVIKYCQKSFLKVYPNIFRTDSSNHDPVKSWICGAQISALNLQRTDDDSILINKIFFKINGGSRSGFILKPEHMRDQNITPSSLELRYIRPAFKIKFKVLSGFHLHDCFPSNKKIKGVYVEVSLRGTQQDDENPKLVTSTIVENFLHPVWKSNSLEFEVYEPELSFFVVKIFSKNGKNVLARGVIPVRILSLGYRILDLYDMACTKFEQSFLIIKTNKIFV